MAKNKIDILKGNPSTSDKEWHYAAVLPPMEDEDMSYVVLAKCDNYNYYVTCYFNFIRHKWILYPEEINKEIEVNQWKSIY